MLLVAGIACSGRTPDSPRAASGSTTEGDGQSSALTVRITGEDYRWHIRYAGPDGRLDTKDDIRTIRNLHLPGHTDTEILLNSKDYLYTLALPHLALKEIAVPDMTFQMRFTTTAAGSFDLLGDQMCGYAHTDLLGKMVVQSRPDFEAWLRAAERQQP